MTVLMLACLAFLCFVASSVAAEPKSQVATLGSAEAGEAGSEFSGARGVAVNYTGAGGVPAGTFYVVDSGNRRVQRFGPDGNFVSAWGWGVLDDSAEPQVCSRAAACRRGFSGAPTRSTEGLLVAPRGIAVDQASGVVYVTDVGFANGARISVFGPGGAPQGAFGWGAIDESSSFQFCNAASGCSPRLSFFASGQGGAFPIDGIDGLAVAGGDLYVADAGYRRVDVLHPTLSGGVVTGVSFLRSFGWGVASGAAQFEVCTVAASCQPGIAGSGLGQFASDSPSDLAVDGGGDVFALDSGNGRVQRFSPVPAPLQASFAAAPLAAVFGGGRLLSLAIDSSTAPGRLLVAGRRADLDGRVAVAELDDAGLNTLSEGRAHGEGLTATAAGGLAATPASLGGNLYLTADAAGSLRGVRVLGEAPLVGPVTDVEATTAVLRGSVVSNGAPVSYRFELSRGGGPWQPLSTSFRPAGTAAGRIAVEAEASGLSGSQEYVLRLAQDRGLYGGVGRSTEIRFQTAAAAPRVSAGVAAPVAADGATLVARLDPQNEPTTYRFEYGPADCSANPCTALPSAQLEGAPRLVAQSLTGLTPGAVYHYRLLASNGSGAADGPDRAFQTFSGGSALPDGRRLELVTPPDTGAVVLGGAGFGNNGPGCFDLYPVSGNGGRVISQSAGGALVGLAGNGNQDLYESIRGRDGWRTVSRGPTGAESYAPGSLCFSRDHSYTSFVTGSSPTDQGRLVIDGLSSSYLRGPDGVSTPLGVGDHATDPGALLRWIGAGGQAVFSSRAALVSGAPGAGVEAVYERRGSGPVALLSRPPVDADVTTTTRFENDDAQYQGVAADGSAVAFKVAGDLYLRRAGETLPVASAVGAALGTRLSCSAAAAASTEFRWLRDGQPVAAAESESYELVAADAGHSLQCQAFSRNANSGSTQVSNPPVLVGAPASTALPQAPANIPQPGQSGSLAVPGPALNRTLTCATGTWSGSPIFTYQWYRDGVAIAGATGSTYVVLANSLTQPAAFQCAVTGSNAAGRVVKVSANRLTAPAPSSPAAPVASASTGASEVVFAGLSADGRRLFFEQRGDPFVFDSEGQATGQLAAGGASRLVNVGVSGARAYLVSSLALSGSQLGEDGRPAQVGRPNLYLWDGGGLRFVVGLDPGDVEGAVALNRWSAAVGPGARTSELGRGSVPARTTHDGSVLVFESRVSSAGDAAGRIQIYRYDATAPSGRRLACVSCSPLEEATGDSRLQVTPLLDPDYASVNGLAHIENVSEDGRTVFFETTQALVPTDHNGTWDVYEWKLGQQAYLLSSGRSSLPSHLYAMTPSGSDVFFTTAERLLAEDASSVLSIYDARVDGGFDGDPAGEECAGDACQGPPAAAPQPTQPGSSQLNGPSSAKKKSAGKLQAKKKKKRRGSKAAKKRKKRGGGQVGRVKGRGTRR